MPNIRILSNDTDSIILEAVQASNIMKAEREALKRQAISKGEAAPSMAAGAA